MAAETELERMVIRLRGDGKSYENMLKRAQVQTKVATRSITASTTRMTRIAGVQLTALGRKFRALGRTAMMRLTMPIAALGGVAV